MGDDVFCLFIITVCLVILAASGVDQLVIGLFAFFMVLAVLASSEDSDESEGAPSGRHPATGP